MTTEPKKIENPKDAVLEKIRAGAVTMRPKLYFILKAFVVALVAVLVLAVSIFLASFIFFAIRLNGSDSLLGFGSRGLSVFLEIFPWPLALIDLGLIVLLEWLVRRFRFGYSRSLLLLLLGLVVLVCSASIVVERGTSFHDDLFEHAEKEGLPAPLQSFYLEAHQKGAEDLGVFRGIVVSEGDGQFVMTYDDIDNDEDEHTWTVLVPDGFDIEGVSEGDRVFVAGDSDDGVIRAYGIRVLAPIPAR